MLTWADVYLDDKGEHIAGRSVPLDNVAVRMDLIEGRINIHPLSFGVGKGRLVANADVVPVSDSQVRAKAMKLGGRLAADGSDSHLPRGRCRYWHRRVRGHRQFGRHVTRRRQRRGEDDDDWRGTCRPCWSICRGCISATPCSRRWAFRSASGSNASSVFSPCGAG